MEGPNIFQIDGYFQYVDISHRWKFGSPKGHIRKDILVDSMPRAYVLLGVDNESGKTDPPALAPRKCSGKVEIQAFPRSGGRGGKESKAGNLTIIDRTAKSLMRIKDAPAAAAAPAATNVTVAVPASFA